MKTRPKITLFGMSIDSLDMQESVDTPSSSGARRRGSDRASTS